MLLFSFISLLGIGLCHIYLYILLLGQRVLNWVAITTISLFFIITLTLSVSLTSFPELNFIILFIFLLLLGRFYKQVPLQHNILFTLLSITSFTVLKNGLFSILLMTYFSSSASVYIWTSHLLQMVSVIILAVIIYLARSYISDIGRYVVKSRWYMPTYAITIFCSLLLLIINYPKNPWLAGLHNTFASTFSNILFIATIVLLLMLILGTVMSKERLLDKLEQEQQEQLVAYVKKLEYMHDELITFRHDYLNLLLSLEHAIREEDMEQIKQSYYEVLAPTGVSLNHIQIEQTKLSHIEVVELKSLISVKLLHAERQQIEVQIDIPQKITTLPLPLATYLRIASIFIDNAIEGALQSSRPSIQISLFEVNHNHYFIIKNSLNHLHIDLQQLYKKDYSHKGDSRGIGLYSAQRLIKKYAHATLMTELEEAYFKQELCVKNN